MPSLPPHWKTGGGPSGGLGVWGCRPPMSTVQLITCPALSPSARRRGAPDRGMRRRAQRANLFLKHFSE